MRRRRGNANIKILQSQIQNLALKEEEKTVEPPKEPMTGLGVKLSTLVKNDTVELNTRVKKKGVPKDELINTKRLLTM